MSKYVWDVEKFKSDSSNGLEKMIYSLWYAITIDSKGNHVVSDVGLKNEEVIANDPTYLYTFTSDQEPNFAFYIEVKEGKSTIDLKGYSVRLRGKSLKDYIKKLFPKIEINGQVIGGLKLKDNSGVIKEVSNIRYKDNSGIVKNLK